MYVTTQIDVFWRKVLRIECIGLYYFFKEVFINFVIIDFGTGQRCTYTAFAQVVLSQHRIPTEGIALTTANVSAFC